MHQLCSPLVDELMYQTEYYRKNEVTVGIAKNMSGLCDNVVSCFKNISCSDSQRNLETYEQKCEKLEFKNYDIQDCLPAFYEAMFRRENSCTSQFLFTSKNLTAKRNAFVSGKQCFLYITKQVCSPMANTFFNTNYDKFLDILTAQPSNNRCNSISEEAKTLSCLPILNELSKNPSVPLCDRVNNCMKDVCAFSTQLISTMKKSCANLSISLFRQCYYTILTSNKNYSGYQCVKNINNAKKVSNQVPGSNSFSSDKGCMSIVMRGECPDTISRKEFDKNWEDRTITNVDL